MLQHLQVRDFAIIDAVEVDLRRGLCVLTGETGAGKSILVDALQLAAGGRAGSEVVRHGAERAEITATFALGGASPLLHALLNEQSIETDGELIVRRLVTRDGKSRAYLNGQLVPLQVLREVGEWLTEIHGQHEFQSLVRPAAQRALLDTFAEAEAIATQVSEAHRERLAHDTALQALRGAAADRDARLELLRHQIAELEPVAARSGDLGKLVEERNRLANSGRLAEAAREALSLVYEAEENNAHAAAARALARLRAAATLDPTLAARIPTLEEAVIRLADTGAELSRYLDDLEADPARQDQLERELATIEGLARKHRCEANALGAKLEDLRTELTTLERLEHDRDSLEAAVAATAKRWLTLAEQLSSLRQGAAKSLSEAITARMQTLGMQDGRFAVTLTPRDIEAHNCGQSAIDTHATGLDEIEFLVSANAGQPLRPLGKVASGGELSRLSLAVQVTLAMRTRSESSACMVFDEVDTGVGGAVAEIVGRELATLAASAQVLCVTHLPQVAAFGNQHFRVAKASDGATTHTRIEALEEKARIEEIARMLGGLDITATAREHAAAMLTAAEKFSPSRVSPPRGAGTAPVGNARKSRARGR
jgi:DNA repair protein RecN (Recombination protein N)